LWLRLSDNGLRPGLLADVRIFQDDFSDDVAIFFSEIDSALARNYGLVAWRLGLRDTSTGERVVPQFEIRLLRPEYFIIGQPSIVIARPR
jgi:hypothetical protein